MYNDEYSDIIEERMFLTGKSFMECLYMSDEEVQELAEEHLNNE